MPVMSFLIELQKQKSIENIVLVLCLSIDELSRAKVISD